MKFLKFLKPLGSGLLMSSKQKYCPSWIYDCVVADVCSQFLSDHRPIENTASILLQASQTLQRVIGGWTPWPQEIGQFLIRLEKPLPLIFYQIFLFSNFIMFQKLKKKFQRYAGVGILVDGKRGYSNSSTLRSVKAYYYDRRSGNNEIGCLDWKLENQPEINFLRASH